MMGHPHRNYTRYVVTPGLLSEEDKFMLERVAPFEIVYVPGQHTDITIPLPPNYPSKALQDEINAIRKNP